jgi:hypothetical protein
VCVCVCVCVFGVGWGLGRGSVCVCVLRIWNTQPTNHQPHFPDFSLSNPTRTPHHTTQALAILQSPPPECLWAEAQSLLLPTHTHTDSSSTDSSSSIGMGRRPLRLIDAASLLWSLAALDFPSQCPQPVMETLLAALETLLPPAPAPALAAGGKGGGAVVVDKQAASQVGVGVCVLCVLLGWVGLGWVGQIGPHVLCYVRSRQPSALNRPFSQHTIHTVLYYNTAKAIFHGRGPPAPPFVFPLLLLLLVPPHARPAAVPALGPGQGADRGAGVAPLRQGAAPVSRGLRVFALALALALGVGVLVFWYFW